MIDLKNYDFRLNKIDDKIDDHILISEKYRSYFIYTVEDKFYASVDLLQEWLPKPGDAFKYITKITEIFIEISEIEFLNLFHRYYGEEYEPD